MEGVFWSAEEERARAVRLRGGERCKTGSAAMLAVLG